MSEDNELCQMCFDTLCQACQDRLSGKPKEDPYIVGLYASEVRETLSRDYEYFKNKENLDSIMEALGEFNYRSLWDDVTDFAEAFINDNKPKDG